MLLAGLALVVACAAAVRGVWSPCGLSMLSTITPLAERARGHRFATTAAWFLAGAVLGGMTLGAGMAALAAVTADLGVGATLALSIAALAALVAATSDSRILGRQLPFHIRQVNEDWLNQFRVWVYAGGFGWQIGVGLATYIMTAGVYLLIVMGALTGQPLVAFALGTVFGLVRGCALFLGARVNTPADLLRVHKRFEAWREPVRRAVITVEAAVATVAAAGAWGFAVPTAVVAVACAGVTGYVLIAKPRDAGPTVDVVDDTADGHAGGAGSSVTTTTSAAA